MALLGNLGFASHSRVFGWAFETDRPDIPVNLIILANDEVVWRGVADQLRPDLIPRTKDKGRHGFNILLQMLSRRLRYIVEVRREEDGAPVPNGLRAVEPGLAFDAAAVAEWQGILAGAETDQEYEARLNFLLDQTAKLRDAYLRRRVDFENQQRRRHLRWTGTKIAHTDRSRLLVLDVGMPDPNRDAGSNAVISHIKAMQALGFEVHFAPANLAGDGADLETIGVSVYKRPLVESIENLLKLQRDSYAVVYLHRVQIASRYLELARVHQPRARILYSVADLHHLRLARQAAVEGRPELQALAEQVRLKELTSAWAADAVITHSQVEAKLLAKHMPSQKIFVVPWAVDLRRVRTPFCGRAGVAFIAGFAHGPNVDAAHWLVDQVMPEVWRRNPGVECVLAGSQTPPTLSALASERVQVLGFVPDLAEIFERVRLTVAPLAYGAGLKGKVLESLAAGVPCVCTPVAAEGFGFTPPLSELVGGDVGALASLIVSMHEDADANAAAAEAGLRFVREFAGKEAVIQALGRALGARQSA
jgi:glycosyltransferase involved in cell wall biosynthesis